jgi:hypothetical protein
LGLKTVIILWVDYKRVSDGTRLVEVLLVDEIGKLYDSLDKTNDNVSLIRAMSAPTYGIKKLSQVHTD